MRHLWRSPHFSLVLHVSVSSAQTVPLLFVIARLLSWENRPNFIPWQFYSAKGMTGYLARRRLTGHVAGDGFVCNWAMTPVTLLQVRSTFLRHPQRESGRLMFEGEWHRHQNVNRLTQPCRTVRRRPKVKTFRLKCKTAQVTFISHQVTVAAATTHRFQATATLSGQTM